MLINLIACDEILDQAFQWLCEKRAHHHFNADVWQVKTIQSSKLIIQNE